MLYAGSRNLNPILFYIVLTIVMQQGQENISYRAEEPSYEQCLADAKEFLSHDLPDNIKDPQGKFAVCEQHGIAPHKDT